MNRDAPSQERPALSVIIPALDAIETLPEQLAAIARQVDPRFHEVLVVDNGSSDGTVEFVRDMMTRQTWLRLESSPDRGAGRARNYGVDQTTTPLLAFVDADDLVGDRWLDSIESCLSRHDVCTGPLDASKLNSDGMSRSRGRNSTDLSSYLGLFPTLAAGNFGIRRTTWNTIGGFDPRMVACEDIELSLRAHVLGIEIGFAEGAIVHYRFRTRPAELFRQGLAYGAGRVAIAAELRRRGLARPPWYSGWRSWVWLVSRLPTLGTSDGRRRFAWVAGNRLGHVSGSVRHRIVLL